MKRLLSKIEMDWAMKELDAKNNPGLKGADPDSIHFHADGALRLLLLAMGYEGIVDAYDKLQKWPIPE